MEVSGLHSSDRRVDASHSFTHPVRFAMPLPPHIGMIVLPATAAVLFALGAMAIKRASQLGADVWQTAFSVNLVAAMFYSFIWFAGGPPVQIDLWYQPTIIAVCLFGGMVSQFIALHRGDISVAVPVMGLKLLVVALLNPWVVGEAIPPRLWIAVVLSLVGVTLLNRGAAGASSGKRSFTIAVTAGFLAALCFGAFDLFVARWGPQWGVGRLLPCVFWINGLLSLACIAGFRTPLWSLSRSARAWLALGALLISFQGLLFIGCLAVYGKAVQPNVTYAIRGLVSVFLVWTLGRYFHNQEARMGDGTLLYRLIGAASLFAAVVIAAQ
jgi:drug/metabolite transporter (DMT)-like permease